MPIKLETALCLQNLLTKISIRRLKTPFALQQLPFSGYTLSFPLPELTGTPLFSKVQNFQYHFGIGLPESSISNWSTTATNTEN